MLHATSIIVLASHSKELILRACNRVVWLEHGKIKDFGEPEEIVSKYFGA